MGEEAQKNKSGQEAPLGTPVPDVGALMAEIRARVRADVKAADSARPFRPAVADGDARAGRKAGELLHSEELRYLNLHHTYPGHFTPDSVTTHRKGIVGKIIVKAKRKLMRMIFELWREYFDAEREYQAHVVRFLNDVSKYVDARDASNFWELIRKIDYDVTKALERIERIGDEQGAALRTTERRVFDELEKSLKEQQRYLTELLGTSAQHDARLNVLDSVTRGLERVAARATATAANLTIQETKPFGEADLSYLLLENRFRGSEEEIAKRVALYPELFRSAAKPVLEIGGGRGELLQKFRAAGIAAYSVDLDAAMVDAAKEKGLDVRLGDGLKHLAALPDRSLGGVIAIQVVEHLTREQLKALGQLCAAKVQPGGRIVFETINPQSVTALSSNYFRDPTHVFPLHPDTLSFLLELSGLEVVEVRMLSPVAPEAQLREVPVDDYMTPRWAFAVEAMNRNVRQLNALLYGNQDFCVIAQVKP